MKDEDTKLLLHFDNTERINIMWKVEANHPTEKRGDAWFLDRSDAESYAARLQEFDYDHIVVFEDVLNAEVSNIQSDVYMTACEKGWHDEERTFGDIIALCHSELSEALEEFRKGREVGMVSFIADGGSGKPVGIPIELADCIIRILDYCGSKNINMQQAILTKLAYNKTRDHRHGGKKL